MIRSYAFAAAALAIAASALNGCSSTDEDNTQQPFTGTLKSASFIGASTIATYGSIATNTTSDGGSAPVTTDVPGLTIVVFDKVETCAVVHEALLHAVSIQIPGSPTAGSTFTIIDADKATPVAGQASADYSGSTATCADDGTSETGTSGTITIDAIDATSVTGRISATFPGGTVGGGFTASICAPTPDDAGEPACQP